MVIKNSYQLVLLILVAVEILYFLYRKKVSKIAEGSAIARGLIIEQKSPKGGSTDLVYEYCLDGKRIQIVPHLEVCAVI